MSTTPTTPLFGTAWPTAAEITTATLAYNTPWLETDATSAEQFDFMRFLADGAPVRMVIVERYTGAGGGYRVTVTHGLRLDGAMVAAEDPAVGRVYATVRRGHVVRNNAAAAEAKFGQDLPDGVELVVTVR